MGHSDSHSDSGMSSQPVAGVGLVIRSRQRVPGRSSSALLGEQLLLHQISEVFLERVPAGAGRLDHRPHGDTTVVAGVIQNRDRQFGKDRQSGLLPLDLDREAPHLLLQGAQEK
jgi:hypothetical protein